VGASAQHSIRVSAWKVDWKVDWKVTQTALLVGSGHRSEGGCAGGPEVEHRSAPQSLRAAAAGLRDPKRQQLAALTHPHLLY
jgi:hypothetical protein